MPSARPCPTALAPLFSLLTETPARRADHYHSQNIGPLNLPALPTWPHALIVAQPVSDVVLGLVGLQAGRLGGWNRLLVKPVIK
jgi:hypothetical protein